MLVAGDRPVRDGRARLGHGGRRGRQVAVERQAEKLPVGRIGEAAEPQGVGREGPAHDPVLHPGQAPPAAIRIAQPRLGIAAVAVCDAGEHPAPVLGGLQLHLGDARELVAHLVRVRIDRGTELVPPDLLVEVQVGGSPLPLVWVAGVEQRA